MAPHVSRYTLRTVATPSAEYSILYSEGKRGETILAIHGLGSDKSNFLTMFDYPAFSDYTVVVPDLIGFGSTEAPAGFSYTMQDQAGGLVQLLDELGMGDRVHVVAHSMGGPIGVGVGEQLGDRVASLVYAEGNLDFNDCFGSNLFITRYTREQFPEALKRMIARNRASELTADYADTLEAAGPESIYSSSIDLVAVSKADTLLDRITALNVPVLAVFGEKNRGKFTSEAKLASRFPVVFIPGAEHGMMHDNPDAFYTTVAGFLRDI